MSSMTSSLFIGLISDKSSSVMLDVSKVVGLTALPLTSPPVEIPVSVHCPLSVNGLSIGDLLDSCTSMTTRCFSM